MGRDQELKWLAFSLYPISFFLYSPFKYYFMSMIVTKFVLFLGFNILIDMLKLVKTPSIFYSNSTITFLPIIYLVSFNQGRSGGRYPCVPPRPPLEPEAGSNLVTVNLHTYSDFLLFLSINNVTIGSLVIMVRWLIVSLQVD